LARDLKIQRQADIIKAASVIFSEKGYPNAKMQEIATKAGMGKGTIYQYFRGKKHLFQQVIKSGMRLYIDGIKKEIEHSGDLEDMLKKVAAFSFTLINNHNEILKMVEIHQSLIDEDMTRWILDRKNKAIDIMTRAIYKRIEETRPDDFKRAEFASYCFWGMVLSMIQEKVFHKKDFETPAVVDHLVGIFLHGYLSEAGMKNY